jgi:hypothetical protein
VSTYFYEPFLEAFDPALREELGVWYTPPDIVRYQVRRIHHILKSELQRPRGLADSDVVILDPCCGTGAYLLEVARCIADELRAEGELHTLALELLRAFEQRIVGFEILTAPFAISQLQLYILFAELGVPPPTGQRLSIFLTNALTGWHDPADIKITFPEMRDEFDASQAVKRSAKIIVILGNPPYDRFAGAAQAEEAELVAHYKGVELVAERTKDGQIKFDEFGRPAKKQRGQSLLYKEFGIRKQLLDDLYIRFLRLAEERIGETADHGVVSFISNSSYLTGRSHPLMRRSLLSNFHKVWIDNLNGDKFKTGKLIPRGLPGEGTADQSAFTTEMDPRCVQPGTAVVTWLKRVAPQSPPYATEVLYRDLYGLANWKRQALLASLPAGEVSTGSPVPAYERIVPTPENRWRLSPHNEESGYESWPALDELFPVRFQGVNHNRGLEGSVIDTDPAALEFRMKNYFTANTFADAKAACPDLATPYAGYDPEVVWRDARKIGGYDTVYLMPFLTFPLDQRWICYDSRLKLLNRPRPEFGANLDANEFLITVPEPRKASETRPLFATMLVNLHVHERGSVVIPRETRASGLFADRDANLTEPVWRAVREYFGLVGERRDHDARAFVGQLLRLTLAVLHAPAYQAEHKSALSADWAHLPIPRNATLFAELVSAGEQVARLLDANRDARDVAVAILGNERFAALAPLQRMGGNQIRPDDLKITVNYWGGAKGHWVLRTFSSDEQSLFGWGEGTGDLYIGEDVFFANVPEAVWTYQLGGYRVLKKWLGYRQADRRDGKPLTVDEQRSFRSIVQRLAAFLALTDDLNRLYDAAAEDAFTASELRIRDNG